jgi:signal transduction histidine kinase
VERTPSGSGVSEARSQDSDAARIARLETELDEARASLARALAARQNTYLTSDLVGLAAEELRSPATVVSGYLQLLIDGDAGQLGPNQQHMLESAVFHTRRMTDLVDDLVTITQLPAQHHALGMVDLADIVRGRVQQATSLAVSRRVRLEMRLGARCSVVGDGATLGRAVDCLLEHAIMFSPPKCSVVCAVHAVSDGIAIEVSDQGMALDARSLDALLDGRAPTNISDARALLAPRLGLLMVRLIAEAHRGRAEAQVDVARTTLRIVLPAGP